MIRMKSLSMFLAAPMALALSVSACTGGDDDDDDGGGGNIPFEFCTMIALQVVNQTTTTSTENRYTILAPTDQWTSGTITFDGQEAGATILYNLFFGEGATQGVIKAEYLATNGEASTSGDYEMLGDIDVSVDSPLDFVFVEGTSENATFSDGSGSASAGFSEFEDCFDAGGDQEDCIVGAGDFAFVRTSGGNPVNLTIGEDLALVVCDEPTNFAPLTPREWAHKMATQRYPKK